MVFLCERLHIRENRFAPALGQNIMGHRVWTLSIPLTCHALTCSLPFFVVFIILELSWINSLILWCQTNQYHCLWYGMMHQSLWSRYSLWTNRKYHHWWCKSYQPQKAVYMNHIFFSTLSFLPFLFYFQPSVNTTLNHPHLPQWFFMHSNFLLLLLHILSLKSQLICPILPQC